MNEYEALLRIKTDRDHSMRNLRNALLVQELREIEKAQPRRLRFHWHFRFRLPHFSGLRLPFRRQPRCTSTPVNAR